MTISQLTPDDAEVAGRGPRGFKGDKPSHQWTGTSLSFENPDGTAGTPVDLKGASGVQLGSEAIGEPNGVAGLDGDGNNAQPLAAVTPTAWPIAFPAILPAKELDDMGLEHVNVRRLGMSDDSTTDWASTLQAFIDAAPNAKIVFPRASSGYYRFEEPIILPTTRAFTLDGLERAELRLVSSDQGVALFTIKSEAEIWDQTLRIMNFARLQASAFNQSCIGTDLTGAAASPNLDRLIIENIRMTASQGYGVNLDEIDYSIAPILRDIRFSGGGALRVTPSPGAGTNNRHSSSQLFLQNLRSHLSARIGPHYYLEGTQGLFAQNIIMEGVTSWHGSIDPTGKAEYLHIYNPGPNPLTWNNVWFENWGTPPAGVWNVIMDASDIIGAYVGGSRILVKSGNFPKSYVKLGGSGGWVDLEVEGDYIASPFDFPTYSIASSCTMRSRGPMIRDHAAYKQMLDKGIDVVDPLFKNGSAGVYSAPKRVAGSAVLYTYRGGLPFNKDAATYRVPAGGGGIQGTMYMHNDPDIGSCLLVRQNGGAQGQLRVTIGAEIAMRQFIRAGVPLVWEYLMNIPHPKAGMTEQSGHVQFLNRGDLDENHVSQTLLNGWKHARCVRPGGSAGDLSTTQLFWPEGGNALSTLATNPKWILIAGLVAGVGEEIAARFNRVADCWADPNDAATIPLGTHVVGDRVEHSRVSYSYCTAAGTTRPIAVTGNTYSGSPIVDNLSDITEIITGDYIGFAAGVAGKRRVIDIDLVNGTITIDANASSNQVSTAITNSASTWTTV